MFKHVWPLALAMGLSACSNMPAVSTAPAQSYQELDLAGTVDGQPWQGTAVLQDFKTHQIEIQSKVSVNYFVAQNCTRDNKFEDVIQPTELFHWDGNNSWTWMYSPSPGLEDTGTCLLELQAYSKQIGAGQAFGLMIQKNSKFDLPAENICNGADGMASGTSICQSLNGLKERLRFKRQVMVADTDDSNNPTFPKQCQGHFVDAYTFEYLLPAGKCVVVFGTTTAPYQYAIHFGYGYTNRVYRGD